MTLFFAFTTMAQGEFLPGPEEDYVPGPCLDLVISNYNIPSSAPANGVITVTLTITKTGNCPTDAHYASVNIMEASGAGGSYHPWPVQIPAMSANQTSATVTVDITPIFPVAGKTYLITWMMEDTYLQVAETNESNNFISSFPAWSNVITLY